MRVVYVSYDGALDPLGSSQVTPYLVGLGSRSVDMTLVSFEKPTRWLDTAAREIVAASLAAAGVRWRPLVYHKRPRLLATAWDCLMGVRAIAAEARRTKAQIIHCRGDIAMAMARWAAPRGTAMLYDVRGFFADERVEGGSWRRGSLTDRIVRRAEKKNLERADGLVVLTRRAQARLGSLRTRLPPHRVIPTCVDLERFRPRPTGSEPDFGLAYVGSLGSWYMVREMVDFARVATSVIPGKTLFLTPDVGLAREAGVNADWAELRAVAPQEVPAWLARARASFFFIRPTPSKQASCPTKLAEALACGLPVVANSGVGDIDEDLAGGEVGVLMRSFDSGAYEAAGRQLAALIRREGTATRCRDLAARCYELGIGVKAYHELYGEIAHVRGMP
jgi:glycosyltransferase involved in cell wall biosynthesis